MGLSTFDAFKHVKPGDGMVEVSGKRLEALQYVLALMLLDIDRACRDAGVDYTLSGGTCLGAVRHHGFIPWDDDIDLNMPHWQFPAFRRALQRRFPGKYVVQVPGETPGYDLGFPRVRLKGTLERSRDDIGRDRSECGVYVDVFYIENAPSNPVTRDVHGLVSLTLGFLYSCRRFVDYEEAYRKLVQGDPQTERTFAIKSRLGRALSLLPTERWTKLWDSWNSIVKSVDTGYVTIPVGRKHYFGELHERRVFFPTEQARFEVADFPIPGDADAYLRSLYGADYMTPPEERDREVHVAYEFDLGEYGNSSLADLKLLRQPSDGSDGTERVHGQPHLRHLTRDDCGEPVSREECRSIQVSMLNALVSFCSEHGLRYYLSGGTLLGAVRHHGFIPWDDDIDVNMPRPDCERLMELSCGRIGNYYFLGPDRDLFARGCESFRLYSDEVVIESFVGGATKDHPQYYPLFIDVFPIEGLPDSERETRRHYAKLVFERKMLRVSSLNQPEGGNVAAHVFHVLALAPAKAVGYAEWSDRIQRTAKEYSFDDSEWVGVMTAPVHTTEERVLKRDYIQAVEVQFEGATYHAPGNYDLYLRQLYGDYLQLPPEEKRRSHHVFNMYRNKHGLA